LAQHQESGQGVGKKSPRGDKAQDILDAARAEFLARGYAAARLDDIAARAGVAKGTLYLYFQSKEDIFQSLVRTAIVPNLAQLETMAEAWDGPIAPLLERFASVALGVAGNDKLVAIPRLLLAEAKTFPDLARFYYREVARRGIGLLTKIIAKGVASGEFRTVEPLHAARLVIAPFLLHAMWQSMFVEFDDNPVDPAAYAKTHLDVLLNGLRADTGSSE
jgi:AcrR family transcriptional regulator